MIERRKIMKGKICETFVRTRKGKELEKEYEALSKEIKVPGGTTELIRRGLRMRHKKPQTKGI